MSYKHLQKVRGDVVCNNCGEKWFQKGAPFGWENASAEYTSQPMAKMEEIIVPHKEDEGTLLHQQVHRCWCGVVIMVLLRTEEDTITAGHMEIYPTHNEVYNDLLLS